jgi:hypothetical protein
MMITDNPAWNKGSHQARILVIIGCRGSVGSTCKHLAKKHTQEFSRQDCSSPFELSYDLYGEVPRVGRKSRLDRDVIKLVVNWNTTGCQIRCNRRGCHLRLGILFKFYISLSIEHETDLHTRIKLWRKARIEPTDVAKSSSKRESHPGIKMAKYGRKMSKRIDRGPAN